MKKCRHDVTYVNVLLTCVCTLWPCICTCQSRQPVQNIADFQSSTISNANNTVTSWYGRPRVPLLSSDKLQCLGTLWCQITDVTRTLQCSNNSIGPTGNVPLDGGNVPEALSVRLHLAALGKRPADVTVARQWQHVNHTEENKVRPFDLKVKNIEIDFSIRLSVYEGVRRRTIRVHFNPSFKFWLTHLT